MNIPVILFGVLADIVGKPKLMFTECKDIKSIEDKITSEFPELKSHNYLIALDKKIVKENRILEQGNELAFLPPFAGG